MFTSINPATGEPGQSHAELTDAQVEARLAKAQAAFDRVLPRNICLVAQFAAP